MFIIKGKYNGRTEEIDSTTTESEAETLLGEYRLAYGPVWTLWIESVVDSN